MLPKRVTRLHSGPFALICLEPTTTGLNVTDEPEGPFGTLGM